MLFHVIFDSLRPAAFLMGGIDKGWACACTTVELSRRTSGSLEKGSWPRNHLGIAATATSLAVVYVHFLTALLRRLPGSEGSSKALSKVFLGGPTVGRCKRHHVVSAKCFQTFKLITPDAPDIQFNLRW